MTFQFLHEVFIGICSTNWDTFLLKPNSSNKILLELFRCCSRACIHRCLSYYISQCITIADPKTHVKDTVSTVELG